MRKPVWSIRMVLVSLGLAGVSVVVGLTLLGLSGIERQLAARRDVVRLERSLVAHDAAIASLNNIRADVLRALKVADGSDREHPETILTEARRDAQTMVTSLSEIGQGGSDDRAREACARTVREVREFARSGLDAVGLALADPVAGTASYARIREGFATLRESLGGYRDALQTGLGEVRERAAVTAVRVERSMIAYAAVAILVLLGLTFASAKIVQRIATELAESQEEASRLSLHDALTGLPNRAFLAARLSDALDQAEAHAGMTAVLCLDLDRFKHVNDTLGHATGDGLLQAVAGRLQACLRTGDVVARLGGDEFAVVRSPLPRAEDVGPLAQGIIDALSGPYDLRGHRVTIGASVGVAFAPDDATEPGELLKMADIALYRAKADGRGLFRIFERGMDTKLQLRRALEADLRAAVEDDQFDVFYQPLVATASGEVNGMEALVRWIHPQRGMVGPDEFIPLAEETGLVGALGSWVLRRACSDAATWPSNVLVAVNVSAAQFKDATLVETVADALGASGLPPGRLELEITETALLSDTERTVAILHALRATGVRIVMDDFGTGYSSLGYLRSFPFDKIKIDRCFVRDVETSADCKAIIRAVTSLGTNLGIATTAEGVETAAQLAQVRAEGCDQVQGYLFSRPMPFGDAAEFLRRSLPAGTCAGSEPELV